MDTETAKQYLNSYIPANRAVKHLEQDIEQLRAERMSVRHRMDGMPHASGYSDLSDYAAKLDALEQKLIHVRYKRVSIYTDIFDQIEKTEDETEKELLSCRYLRGYSWEKIAEIMQYSYAQVHRIHRRALEHFAATKDQ